MNSKQPKKRFIYKEKDSHKFKFINQEIKFYQFQWTSFQNVKIKDKNQKTFLLKLGYFLKIESIHTTILRGPYFFSWAASAFLKGVGVLGVVPNIDLLIVGVLNLTNHLDICIIVKI